MSEALIKPTTSGRPRLRGGPVWVYMLSIVIASTLNSLRHWNVEQIERVAQWALVFLAPALLVWFVQSLRRRWTMTDGGDLIELYPAQRTAAVPRWFMATMFLVAAVSPFMLFAVHDSDAFVVMVVAFLGVLLFCVAWLWFDGIPLEVRRSGLVVDGIHMVRYEQIDGWEALKRSNVIELHHHGRITRIYVCPNERHKLLAILESNTNDASTSQRI